MSNTEKHIKFKNPIKAVSSACSGGKPEHEGPYGKYLDILASSDDLKTGTFEKAEAETVRLTVNALMSKAKITEKDVDLMLGGDLLNQCTSTGYGLEGFDIPYLGLYGACSTFALGLLTAGCLIDSGHINSAIVVASSHFCSAERQFRFPLEYGAIANTTSQTTVTGAGAIYLTKADEGENGAFISGGMYGIVCDNGINDASNMGAAMATAAADTVLRYLKSSGEPVTAFEKIATGDLGSEGLSLTKEFLFTKGVKDTDILCDCGEMIFDTEKQNVGCGGSGCGCSAVMTSGFFLDEMKKKNINRFALVGTGAMMSPQSLLQKLTIPAVAHMVVFENR